MKRDTGAIACGPFVIGCTRCTGHLAHIDKRSKIQLLQKHMPEGYQKELLLGIVSKPGAYAEKRLDEAVKELAAEAVTEHWYAADVKEQPEPSRPKRSVDIFIDNKFAKLTPELLTLHDRTITLLREITALRAEIDASIDWNEDGSVKRKIKGDAYRHDRIKKIAKLDAVVRKNFRRIDHYRDTGEDTGLQDMIHVSRQEVVDMLMAAKQNPNYIHRYKKSGDKEKQAKVAEKQRQLAEIDEFINTA